MSSSSSTFRNHQLTSLTNSSLVAKVKEIAKFSSPAEEERLLSGLRWIGLFSSEAVTPRGNLLDTLCATLEAKMQYEQGERDMVMLQHKFEIENKDGSKVGLSFASAFRFEGHSLIPFALRCQQETHTSTLLDYGAPVGSGAGPSSMAKLVGVPCGVSVQLILDGVITKKG